MAKKAQIPADSTETKKNFDITSLSENEQKEFLFFQKRKIELQEVRSSHYGKNLDQLWADADRDYAPHRINTAGKKALVEDETKGWRGTSAMVQLGTNDWQSDISQSNPFIKITTALSILVDQNPSGVFTATSKKYQATTELMKQLYQRSWEFAKSKPQLKLFVHNLCKYGWAAGRTYPLRITRKVRVLKDYNQEEPDKSVYEEQEIVEYNDIYRENLDPRNTWIDDMAKPNNSRSVKDWMWRKVYDMDAATEEFGKYKNWQYVQAGGITDEVVTNQQSNNPTNQVGKNITNKNLVEIYFYENLLRDSFVVMAHGIPVIIEPLPISDAKGNKKLSLWQAFWNLRHAESPYGIGIYEAIRYDNALLDRVRNMTIDQLTLSIYKMFFYQGTQALTETGDILIAPGVGKQTLDPKNINFLQVPGPGSDAYKGLEMFQTDVDKASGITDPLIGQVTGKTAFELAQAKEAALKRLKDPLDNILEALNIEGYITISLIQLLYSIPETYKISDPVLIEDYLKEIQADPDLWERNEAEQFIAKVYPEFPLNLEKDDQGNLIETQDNQFFRVKPKFLEWEGIVNIKSQSLLTPSKQIDKALELEMYNVLIPLLVQPPQIYSKVAKNIVKLYDKDPREILPEEWLMDPEQLAAKQAEAQQNQPLIIPQDQAQGSQQQTGPPNAPPPAQQSQVPASAVSSNPQSLVSKISSKASAPFRAL